jgi:hypothetical protein
MRRTGNASIEFCQTFRRLGRMISAQVYSLNTPHMLHAAAKNLVLARKVSLVIWLDSRRLVARISRLHWARDRGLQVINLYRRYSRMTSPCNNQVSVTLSRRHLSISTTFFHHGRSSSVQGRHAAWPRVRPAF